ncbi:MAG: hypothetical protein ABJC39_12670, partial [Chloroflexota bacterium]
GEILDAASAGERILIERDHKPLAYLVSVEEGDRLDPAAADRVARKLAAIDRLVAFGKEMREKDPDPFDGLSYVEWRQRDIERRTDQILRAARSERSDE